MNQHPEKTERAIRLFVQHQAELNTHVRILMPPFADIDGVMQEVAVVIWKKINQLDDDENFVAWAKKIARFEVLAEKRKRARDRLEFRDEVWNQIAEREDEEPAVTGTMLRLLPICIAALQTQYRHIVGLFLDGQKDAQIAKTIQASESTARRRRLKALDLLRSCLDKRSEQYG